MAESSRERAVPTEEVWQALLARATPPSRYRAATQKVARSLNATVRTLPKQIPRTVIIAGVAFALGWIGNVWLLAFEYDGFRSPPGSPATGQGSRVTGILYWMLLSAVVVAIVSYRLKVGGPRFRADVLAFPSRLKQLLTTHRSTAVINVLWGVCGGLVLALFTGTSLLLLGGLTLVGGLASFARPFLLGMIRFVWRTVAGRVAPGRKRPPAPGAIALAGMGALAAALVAGTVPEDSTRVVLALIAGGVAFALGRQRGAPKAAVAGLFFALAWVGFVAAATLAAADDGGAKECRGRWPDDCPGVGRVFGEALTGATAALIGALIGDSVGRAGTEDDEEEDPCYGICNPGDEELGEDEYYVIEWEWVEVTAATATGTRSKEEYDKAQAEGRPQTSYEKAMAKKAEIEALEAKVNALDDELAELERKINETLSAKPWGELTATERAATKKQLIASMKAQGQSDASIQQAVGYLESDPGMSTGDFVTYLLGEVVLQTPGEAWKLGEKGVAFVGRELELVPSILSNLGPAYAEDVASGQQLARLTNPFTNAYEYYSGRTVAQVQADFAEIARVTGDGSYNLSAKAAQGFIDGVEAMHAAQVSGDVPSVAQPVAMVVGAIVTEEIFTMGLGKAMKLGRAGMKVLANELKIKRLESATGVQRTGSPDLTPDGPSGGTGGARAGTADGTPAPIENYVKAPKGTPIDSDAKLADFGALRSEADAMQRVVNEEGVIIEMRPGGRERAGHLATGEVGQKGQYNHNNTVKAADLELGLGFRAEDVGLAGGLTPSMYTKLSDPAHFASLSPTAQARARERMTEYIDRQHEVAKLAEGKFERVPDPNSPSGRSTVTQRRIRDEHGVDRDPTTGMADTGDWDIGDIRLPDRSFFHDEFGKPLTDHALLRADQAKYNAVVKRLMAEVGNGSIRHPGGYWRPKIKIVKNKKTGLPEMNCADVMTNRRINNKNYEGNPDAEANLQFTPGGESPNASYRSSPAPRYDQAIPGE